MRRVPAVVRRAVELYGPSLAGVVVFGSLARGEAADESDVDLLVVLDQRHPLTRPLYAPWDAEPARELRRDLELAFCGAEDLTPSGFYSRDDAPKARDGARLTVRAVSPHV